MSEEPVPEEISCSDQVFDISFHPTSNFLAAGLIDGVIEVWKYGVEEAANQLLFKSTKHTASCRGVRFNARGDVLYSISSDKSLRGLDGNGNELFMYSHAHDSAVNRLCCITENTIVTGDDAGEVKLWDLRMGADSAAVMQWNLHEDFVSGFCYHEDANTLLSISGDSTLCMYDFRNKKTNCRSDEQESELQCIQVLKGGRKIVTGTQDGVMLLFSWDKWGDCSDRYPGHPETVYCMWKIDESTVITGSSDGLLRVVSLLPNKILGVIGDHEEFPVEGLCATSDGKILGSFAHDEVVRFWDISMFAEDDGDEFDAEEEEEAGVKSSDAAGASSSGSGSGSGSGANKKKAVGGADNTGDAPDSEAEEEEEGDWEDADEDDEDVEMDASDGDDAEMEDEEEEGEGEGMEGSSDSNDNDDSDSDDENAGKKGPKMLPTASEKFFADL